MSQLLDTLYLSGRTLYVVIHSGGQVWNKDSAAFENYNQGNWTHYAVPLIEQTSSGYYSASYPSAIPAGTLSTDCLYQQNGATPVLPALPGGDSFLSVMQSQGSNIQTIAGDGTAPINLAASADGIIPGVVATGILSTTQFTSGLGTAFTTDGCFNGRVAIFTSGALKGQASIITGYSHTGGLVTVSPPFTGAPSNGDLFVIS
jgi:hypothetical protein